MIVERFIKVFFCFFYYIEMCIVFDSVEYNYNVNFLSVVFFFNIFWVGLVGIFIFLKVFLFFIFIIKR